MWSLVREGRRRTMCLLFPQTQSHSLALSPNNYLCHSLHNITKPKSHLSFSPHNYPHPFLSHVRFSLSLSRARSLYLSLVNNSYFTVRVSGSRQGNPEVRHFRGVLFEAENRRYAKSGDDYVFDSARSCGDR